MTQLAELYQFVGKLVRGGFIVITSPDICRLETASLKVAHCILPPWHDGEVDSVTMPGSIGLAFTHQTGAIVLGGNGRAARRDVVANSIGLGGAEPTAWLRVEGPSDIIEITASRNMRREIAEELDASEHADLDDIDNWHDPIVHSIALRFRAALRDRWPFDPLEADELARAAYARVLHRQFGASKPQTGALAPARLANVVDFITANLPHQLSIAELADVAALSPFHFARSFRRATGLPPNRFVTALRMAGAAERLQHSRLPVEEVAEEIGFSNVSHFRRLFRMHYGCSPSAVRG